MNIKETQTQLISLSKMEVMPKDHTDYLLDLKEKHGVEPKVIYDIGSCVLHWVAKASKIWTESKFYLFDGMDSVGFLYEDNGYEYNIDVLSDVDDKEITFYQSDVSPGGNSYYKEYSWATEIHYGKDSERTVKTMTLDTVVKKRKFLYPDLIKLDVQGCEVDILKGATEVLKHCTDIIVELQHSEYNIGAPLTNVSIPFIESLGFKLITPLFCNNGPDGDYHFKKI